MSFKTIKMNHADECSSINTRLVLIMMMAVVVCLVSAEVGAASEVNVTFVGNYDAVGDAKSVVVSGSYAYVANYTNGLVIVDISNPASPMLAGSYYTGSATDIAISDSYAYVANEDNGLVIVNISNTVAPVLAGSYDTSGYAMGVAISGSYAYVANDLLGLLIVDISNPISPVLVGSYDTAGYAMKVVISGNYAYVADFSNGLVIIDVSNPASPVLVGSYDTTGYAMGVAISGSYAYVTDDWNGLVIIDVSNPASPVLVGSYDTLGYAMGVAVSGGYAYIADNGNGLVIVDINNPALPALVSSYDTLGYAKGVAVSGSYAYISDWTNGLVILCTYTYVVDTPPPAPSSELVFITGQQTTPIIWNASNFAGFKHNSSDTPSTETLTIGPYTLNGPDIDRIIEAGNLTYTTSFVLNEYPIFKDLGLYVNNFDDGYSTGYLNGKQYVAINAFSEKLATPLVKFDSNDVKTLRTGDVWDIGGGFSITVLQVDIDGNKVWIELDKDGVFLEDEIISVGYSDLQDRVWTHNEDVAGEYDIPILSLYVSGIMHGEDTDYVQIKYLSLIDNNVSEIFFDDRFGNMELTTITANSLEFSNWIDLDLSPGNSPSMIMENMSFITLDNLSSIEFYPSVVRNEIPTLYDASGFISGNYSSLWNLSEGYTIALQEVDIEGDKAMFVLLEDGVIIDQKIMTERSIAPNNLDSNYQYIKNGTQIINATLDFAFHGSNSEVVNLINVYQWSEVDSSILLFNESYMFKSTSSTGIPWNLSEGYTLTMKDVSLDADEVWFELSKNDVVVKDDILNEYTLNTSIYTSGNGNISYLLNYIFGGTNENIVKISNVDQYSDINGEHLINDSTHLYKTGNPVGIPWNLSEGYILTMKNVNLEANEVWFELSKNDVVVKDDILDVSALNTSIYTSGNGSISYVLDYVFGGTNESVVKITNVNQYSDINGELLINNSTHLYKTGNPVVIPWILPDGYLLSMKDIDKNSEKVWFELSKDGNSLKEDIVRSNALFTYVNGLESFNFLVSGVMHGTLTDATKILGVNLYSDAGVKLINNGSRMYATSNPSGEIWQLSEGYSLDPKDVDLEGNKVWLSLSKDGTVVKDEIVDVSHYPPYNWFNYSNSNDELVFSTYVKETFSGSVADIVVLADSEQYSEINGTLLFYIPDKTLETAITLNNDTTAPTLAITYPADGDAFTSYDNIITVTGTASDDTVVDSVTVNGILATGASNWSLNVTLSEGENNITVVAIDNAGNQNVETIIVILNPPSTESISIGSATAALSSTVTIPVSLAYTENISGFSFDLIYNSSIATVSSVGASASFTGASITPNIDNINNSTRVLLTFSDFITISSETPVVDITFNVIGDFGSSTSLALQNVAFSDSGFNPYTPDAIVNGSITVGIKGDLNNNGYVDIGDVAKVAFMVAGKVPEELSADFNDNGYVDIGDAAKIAFYLAGKVGEL